MAIKVISQIMDGITTTELDEVAMEQAATMVTIHPDYANLAGRLFVTLLHKETPESFSEATEEIDQTTGLLTQKYLTFVRENTKVLNDKVEDKRDFNHDYFGLKTLERSYLIRTPKKKVIDMAADRQRFICQAQSMNIFMADINLGKLSSMHFYGWSRGLKTGIYYLRSKSAVDAKKFTLDVKKEEQPVDPEEFKRMIDQAREAEDDEDCLMCGS